YKINKEGLSTSEAKIKAIVEAPIQTNITQEIKNFLTSAPILMHFNPNYKISLACDASSYGVGGVISHILPNNEERPIAYTSRTLNVAEQKYSQIDKEAHFILKSDNKPLTHIFHENKCLPQVAANRLQRYALFLANYNYSIKYVKSTENSSADALSRLAIKNTNHNEIDTPSIHFINSYFQGINKVLIQKETESDEILKEIKQYVLTASCNTCSKFRKEPGKSPLQVWEYPSAPGERVHADFLELNRIMFILIIDQYSKWPEVIKMSSTTSFHTINILREYFARYGISKTLVTDNGPQWTSDEFQTFIMNNSIKHILTPPYHPQSNGAAENMVGIFKDKIKKILDNENNVIQAS
ncbi:uncharacterized protein LOC126909726, partial [Daktulosphaira vitifoliae]|uniref:uncharacterized protein LOC126909726 n=1 Tax=Daktulosphaira vitifoliae TaxID=58002 RepID=UPI0021AA2D01